MKKRLLTLVSLASLFVLNGCNCIGDKDSLLARIDKEKVYQEDYTILLKDKGELKTYKNKFLYDELYSKAALVSRALSEYPELDKEWQSYYEDLDPRVLTVVFQRYYVSECLTFSDAELRKFYDANRSLFPADSTGDFLIARASVANYYYASKNQESFAAFLKDTLKLEKPTAEDSLSAVKQFADRRRMELQKEFSGNALETAKIGIQEIPSVEPKAFYEKHKDLFMTVPGYELYHVQGDSLELASLFADSVSLEQFKQIAATKSKNAETAKDSGYVGHVKENYVLPHQIGLVEGLAATLKDKNPGFVTPVIRANDKTFHVFFLASLDPSRLKPFDRVDVGIANGIKSGMYFDVDSSVVLITKAGKPVFTEADLNRYNQKFFHRTLNLQVHQRLVSMIAEHMAFAEMAQKAKLNHSWEYRAIRRSSRLDYIIERYMQKKLGGENIPEDTLKALYDRVGSPIHIGYTFEQAKDDLRKVAAFPKNMYAHEYYMCYRVIYAGKTLDQSIPFIYGKRQNEINAMMRERYAAEAYSKADVYLYDNNEQEYKPTVLYNLLLSKADSLYNAGNKTDAYYEYRKVMQAYADVDSLFERATYGMAIAQAENDEFMDAEGEYYAFYTMWPNSPNAEKAMFSRGFILNENLGWNDRALEVLEGFLQKYPNSELRESAQWLVDNIKSDGKLAEDLMKKIESEE
jgi:hypothetical protein